MVDRASSTPPPNFSPIEFLRTKSLANVVQVEIERMIVSADLAPNERINENALAQRLGVSRGPIREACSALAALGLIQIIPNRGFFVRELSDNEALDVSEARAAVFASMVMALAEKRTAEQLATLVALVDRMDAIVPTGEVSVYYPVNLEFHARLASMAGNHRLSQIYASLVRELHIQRYRALASGDVLQISNAEHRQIVEAVAKGDAVAAFRVGRAHILNGIKRTQKATPMRVTPKAKRDPERVGDKRSPVT